MKIFKTSREIPAPVQKVFAAFSDSQQLEKWWGPAGFTNIFEICNFQKNGQWLYKMKGPDGREYPNESFFSEIIPMQKIVIVHESLPKYVLTISFEPTEIGTQVLWEQEFEKEEVAKAIAHIVIPANEQNLDRLTVEIKK